MAENQGSDCRDVDQISLLRGGIYFPFGVKGLDSASHRAKCGKN
jgi:hypothetical protein